MEHFEKELEWIEDESIRNMTKHVIKWMPDWFWYEPASSTGKYHPQYALGDGGLYRHTVAALKIAHCLFELEFMPFDKTERSYIMAAIMLHDSCKRGYNNKPSKYTLFEHPVIVYDWLMKLKNDGIVDEPYVYIVSDLVASHMGQWNTSKYSSIVLPKPVSPLQQFVHMCDYLASRKFLEVNFND